MFKSIKIRLYPTIDQQTVINQLLGSCRFTYNYCLNKKIEAYSIDKTSLSLTDLNRLIIGLKNTEEYSWLKEPNSKVIQQTLINLETAYKNFFRNKKGFPKFKSRKDGDSCRFPIDAISNINGNRINLTKKINNILFKCSERDEKYLNKKQEWIKSATLSKTRSGDYILSILIDYNVVKSLPITTNSVGLDLGIKDFVITSEGETYDNLKLTRNNALKLAKLQRQLSKKQKGSENRNKARIKLAKYYEKLTNKKQYYLHNIVNQLLNENQVIVIEDLNVMGMMKNHKLARSIQDLSIGEFVRILEYKAKWYGKEVIKIDRFFPSSKLCSSCGYKNNNLKLKDREWICPSCGVTHNRDYNASLNILTEGLKIKIGLSKPEFKLAEHPTMDDKDENPLKSSGVMKQENQVVRLINETI